MIVQTKDKLINLKWKLFSALLLGLGLYFFHVDQAEQIPSAKLLILVLATYTLLIYRGRKNKLMAFIFLYMGTFFIYLAPYFFFNYPIVFYTDYAQSTLYNQALLISFVFVISISFFLKVVPRDFRFPTLDKYIRPNKTAALICILILIIILFTGYSGSSILEGEAYGTSDFGTKTVFTEYFSLFIILAVGYSGNKLLKLIVLGISIIMVGESILYGSRISAFLIIITLFALFFVNRIPFKWLLLGAVFGLIAMNLIGLLRSGVSLSDASNLIRAATTDNGIILSTQSNMFYGSAAFLGLIRDGIWDWGIRVKSLIGFILRLFLPSSYSFEEGSLSPFAQNFTGIGGGALPETYFFVWLGWLGPVALGWLVAHLSNLLHYSPKLGKNMFLFILVLFITMPRWFGYEPGIIFKFGWVLIVLHFSFQFLFKNRHLNLSTNET